MILTAEQVDAIRAAGGKVLNVVTTRDWKRVAALPQGVAIQAFNKPPIRVDRTNTDGEMLTTWFADQDQAVAFAIYESNPWPLRREQNQPGNAGDHNWSPCPPSPQPCTNVLQFPMPSTTRLGAVESFLDRNADRAGNAVARAMRDLADLARRADNARKARRNG